MRFKILPLTRKKVYGTFALLVLGFLAAGSLWIRMPGKSFSGPLPSATAAEELLEETLRHDLVHIASTIGERNLSNFPDQLEETAVWIEQELTDAGWHPTAQEYQTAARTVRNIIVEMPGMAEPEEIVIVGAHYDSAIDTPGANDNGSGTVSLLALTRQFGSKGDRHGTSQTRTLRFVFFVNEEPPWFMHDEMGSLVYARQCKAKRENIKAMLSLETMGYYSDEPDSQKYPMPALKAIFPTTGNFIGFTATTESRELVTKVVESFRRNCKFPSEAAALPALLPGANWSDHWSFSIHGYQAVMVTDTAPFRYPYYHQPEDTPEKVDCARMARVVEGLAAVIAELIK
jgi:Zn-dependent M28 family amino/carboxypeptidase